MGHANTPAAFLTAATARGGAAPTPLPLPFILIQALTRRKALARWQGLLVNRCSLVHCDMCTEPEVGMVKLVEQALLMSEGVVG